MKTFFESLIQRTYDINRNELINAIQNYEGRFKLDFSEDYLNSANLNRLRHIYLAAEI